MLRIEKDDHARGTVDHPVYLVFVKYGNLPEQEVRLAATNDTDAQAEVQARFGVDGAISE